MSEPATPDPWAAFDAGMPTYAVYYDRFTYDYQQLLYQQMAQLRKQYEQMVFNSPASRKP